MLLEGGGPPYLSTLSATCSPRGRSVLLGCNLIGYVRADREALDGVPAAAVSGARGGGEWAGSGLSCNKWICLNAFCTCMGDLMITGIYVGLFHVSYIDVTP